MPDVEPPEGPPPGGMRRKLLHARLIAAALGGALVALELLADPLLVAQVRKFCGL